MSEQTTPRTVEEAAREEAERLHGPRTVGVGAARGSHYRAGFIAGAAWQAARVPSVEEVAEVLAEKIGWQPGIYEAAERVVALWGGGERG